MALFLKKNRYVIETDPAVYYSPAKDHRWLQLDLSSFDNNRLISLYNLYSSTALSKLWPCFNFVNVWLIFFYHIFLRASPHGQNQIKINHVEIIPSLFYVSPRFTFTGALRWTHYLYALVYQLWPSCCGCLTGAPQIAKSHQNMWANLFVITAVWLCDVQTTR